MEANPCQTIEELSDKLNTPWSTIQEHLKQIGKVKREGVCVPHDNARPHSARKTLDKIKELRWEVLPHPSYSPDMAPSDYHLFRSLQHFLSGKECRNVEEVKNGISTFFYPKPSLFYRSRIENLPTRWQNIIDNEGDYIIDSK